MSGTSAGGTGDSAGLPSHRRGDSNRVRASTPGWRINAVLGRWSNPAAYMRRKPSSAPCRHQVAFASVLTSG
jgi:hypothetical protein